MPFSHGNHTENTAPQKRWKIHLHHALLRKVFLFGFLALPLATTATIVLSDEDHTATPPYLQNATLVQPQEPVHIAFPDAVKKRNYRADITIIPQHTASVTWNDQRTILTITPETPWSVGTTYAINLPEADLHNGNSTEAVQLSFETVDLPGIAELSPADGAAGVYAGITMPLAVRFDRPIGDTSLRFVLSPQTDVAYRYNAQEQTAYIFPQKDLVRDTPYTLTVFAKHQDNTSAIYSPLGQTRFRTVENFPEYWPRDLSERTSLAKRLTTPKITYGKYIDVNLDAQVTTLFEDGAIVAMYPASSGKQDTPTPKGEFTIHNKHPYALSRMFQMHLPYWMAFTPDGKYGFHDLPEWPVGHPEVPTGGKESLTSIGVPASPGCVRHNTADSKAIYDWADVGTKVVIY